MARNIIEIIINAEDNASGKISKLLDSLAGAAIVGGVAKLGELGAQSDAVSARFAAFAGSAENANAILSKITSTTGGTVDKMTAMQSATRLMSMGLASTADETSTLINMAMRLGDQTEDASSRIENFSLLLANQSIPRLDSFGISASAVRTRIKELQDANEGMSRETAFMTAVMEEGAVSMELLGDAGLSATKDIDMAKASIKDLTVEVGKLLAPLVQTGAKGFGTLASNANELIEKTKLVREQFGPLAAAAAFVAEGFFDVNDSMWTYIDTIELQDQATSRAEARMVDMAALYEEASTQTITLAENTANSAVVFDQYNMAIASSQESATAAATAQRELAIATTEAQIASDAAAASLGEYTQAQVANAQIELLRQAMEEGAITAQEFADAQTYLLAQSGQLTVAEQNAQTQIDALRNSFINGKISAREMATGIDAVKASLDAIQDKTVVFTIEQRIKTTGEVAAAGGLTEEEARGILGGAGMAEGGAFTVPPGFPNDTYPLRVSSGEQVVVIPNETTNYNLTLNTPQAAPNVEQDFNFMRAFAR